MKPPMIDTEERISLLLLLAGLLLAGGMLYVTVLQVSTLEYDDTISLLAATCHQGNYAAQIPRGEWVSAGDWQRYWQIDQTGCFRTISHDLALYDIHPPLYFWLLHGWLVLTGTSYVTAVMFNLLPHLATAILVFISCRLLGCRPYAGVTASLLWVGARLTVTVPLLVRQYSLLALMAVLLLIALLLYVRAAHLRSGFLVYLIASAGLLTQYTFVLLLLIAVGYCAVLCLQHRQGYRIVGLVTALVGAVGTLFLLHPFLLSSFWRQQEERQAFMLADVPLRVKVYAYSFANSLFPVSLLNPIDAYLPILELAVSIVGVAMMAGVFFWVRRGRHWPMHWPQLKIEWLPAFGSVAVLLTLLTLFTLHLTPLHAHNSRYLALLSPWFAVVVGQLLQRVTAWTRRRKAVVAALLIAHAAYGVAAVVYVTQPWRQYTETARLFDTRPVVLDTVSDGTLPRVLWSLREDTSVYVESRSRLLKSFPVIPATISSLAYIWAPGLENPISGRQKVFAEFERQGFHITAEYRAVHVGGMIYILERTK